MFENFSTGLRASATDVPKDDFPYYNRATPRDHQEAPEFKRSDVRGLGADARQAFIQVEAECWRDLRIERRMRGWPLLV